MAKGGGSANKSYLYQETKALLNPKSMRAFLEKNLKSLGTAACPPYHLAIVIGGTSAEYALKTAKYASARYLDTLPTTGNERGRGFRDVELEAEVLALTQSMGIGAQFGGKYFCHDVRVIRLPRHGASCPVAVAVSCSADRQALGKITKDGVFLEELESDPAKYMPDTTHDDLSGDVVKVDHFKAQAIGIDGVPVANTIPGDPGNFDATTALRFSKGSVTGKVGVDLKLSPDHLLYASYSRGYRGSSFNSQAFFAPDELTIAKPETVDAFEIGAKTQFLDRRLTLNGAVFLYNYKNQQALSLIGVLQPLVNIPKSQIYGAELELVVRPLDVLTLRGGVKSEI